MAEPYTKPSRTVAEQLQHLQSRGLVITNPAKAGQELSRIGYYRFKAYVHAFRVVRHQSELKRGTTFEGVADLYDFDRVLRSVVFQGLGLVEIGIRSLLVERLTRPNTDPDKDFGIFAHEVPKAFGKSYKMRFRDGAYERVLVFDHSEFLSKLNKEVKDSEEVFVRHYAQKYLGFPTIPCWMALQLTSFGSLAKLYSGCIRNIREDVARKVGLHEPVLDSWLHTLSYVRNLCAHHHRLWNRALAIPPTLPEPRKEVAWTQPAITPRIFLVLLMIRKLLREIGSEGWAETVEANFDKEFSDPWFAQGMGFPFSASGSGGTEALLPWKEHVLWK